jgi:hypothetical protein
MFKVKGVTKLSKVQAWLDNPEGKEGDQFQDISIAKFKCYQLECTQTHILETQSKAKGKKHVQSDVSDDKSEDDGLESHLRQTPRPCHKIQMWQRPPSHRAYFYHNLESLIVNICSQNVKLWAVLHQYIKSYIEPPCICK